MDTKPIISNEIPLEIQQKLQTTSGFSFRPLWYLLIIKFLQTLVIVGAVWIIWTGFAGVLSLLGINYAMARLWFNLATVFFGSVFIIGSLIQAYNRQLKLLIIPPLDKQALITQLWIIFDQLSESHIEDLMLFDIKVIRQRFAVKMTDHSTLIVGSFRILKIVRDRFKTIELF